MIAAANASLALLSRDLRAVARSRSQLYSSLLFPLMLLALLGTGVSSGLSPTSPRILDGDYTSYLAPGMIAMTALFSSTFSSAGFYRDRESGLLRAMLASPHGAQTILFGKSLGAILIGSIQALAVLVLAVVIPGIDLSWQFGWLGGAATVVATILALNFHALGVVVAVGRADQDDAGLPPDHEPRPLPAVLSLSGAFFPLDQVPTWLEVIGYINPLTYAVDLLHYAAYADSPEGLIGPLIDGLVLGLLALLLFAVGLRRAPRAV